MLCLSLRKIEREALFTQLFDGFHIGMNVCQFPRNVLWSESYLKLIKLLLSKQAVNSCDPQAVNLPTKCIQF